MADGRGSLDHENLRGPHTPLVLECGSVSWYLYQSPGWDLRVSPIPAGHYPCRSPANSIHRFLLRAEVVFPETTALPQLPISEAFVPVSCDPPQLYVLQSSYMSKLRTFHCRVSFQINGFPVILDVVLMHVSAEKNTTLPATQMPGPAASLLTEWQCPPGLKCGDNTSRKLQGRLECTPEDRWEPQGLEVTLEELGRAP